MFPNAERLASCDPPKIRVTLSISPQNKNSNSLSSLRSRWFKIGTWTLALGLCCFRPLSSDPPICHLPNHLPVFPLQILRSVLECNTLQLNLYGLWETSVKCQH